MGLIGKILGWKRAKTGSDLVGYGPVNYWRAVDPWSFAWSLRRAGLNATSIELFGWFPHSPKSRAYDDPTVIQKPLETFIKCMRFFEITTLISIVNDNLGSGKYTDARRSLGYYEDAINKGAGYVYDLGKDLIIVQPVGETQTEYGKRLEMRILAECNNRGIRTCWNRGSRPTSPGPCHEFAYHAGSTRDMGPANCINVTDHGNLLRELQAGDVYGYCNPDALKAYARAVLSAGARGFIYYGFGHQEVDERAIDALGSVV